MSFRAVAWAFDRIKGLGQGEKLVLLALAEFANDEDETWRSREEIAKRAECSLRSVASHLKTLDECGLISRVPRYSWCGDQSGACADKSAHKHRSGTTYRLHLEVEGNFAESVESTDANLAHVDFSAECSGCGHTCKSCTCGDDRGSTDANSGSPQMQQVAPICTYNPQINHQTKPNQTEPTHEEAPVGCEGEFFGSVGSGVEVEIDSPLRVADAELIAECLPPPLRVLDATGAVAVARVLRECVDAGWQPAQIRQVMDQALPPNVGRLPALVCYRLRANVLKGQPPARSADEDPRVRRERERQAERARQERIEALAAQVELGDVDPLWDQAWSQVVSENPEASRVEQLHLAQERHAAMLGGESA